MKKTNFIKKALVVISSIFALSFFSSFISNNLDHTTSLKNNHDLKWKRIDLVNYKRDMRAICTIMEKTENLLEIVDVERISGRNDKFTEIDFSDLSLANYDENLYLYELKGVNMPESVYNEKFDKQNLRYVDMGDLKWCKIDKYLFNNVKLSKANLKMNIDILIFDKYFTKPANNSIHIFGCDFNEMHINIDEPLRENKQTIGFQIANIKAQKIIFTGGKFAIDWRADYGKSYFCANSKIEDIIFKNELLGINFESFHKVVGVYSKPGSSDKCNIYIKNPANTFTFWSANYEKQPEDYGMESSINFRISDPNARINLLKYNFENTPYFSEWYWSLNDYKGLNKSQISISQKTFDHIQKDEEFRKSWNASQEAFKKRAERRNWTKWCEIIEDWEFYKPKEISSNLTKEQNTDLDVDDTIEFNLNFVGLIYDFFDEKEIKLFEKKISLKMKIIYQKIYF